MLASRRLTPAGQQSSRPTTERGFFFLRCEAATVERVFIEYVLHYREGWPIEPRWVVGHLPPLGSDSWIVAVLLDRHDLVRLKTNRNNYS